MSEKSSEEKLKEIFLNLKTGIKALKSGMELLESGVKKLEEKVLGLTKEFKKVEIKIEKIEKEKEPEKIEILEKIYKRPLEEITFELSNKTLEKIYEKIHKERPDLYTIPKGIEKRGSAEIGKEETLCILCNLGPCEIVKGKEELKGICGADASVVSAKNFARLIAEGASTNLEHARRLTEIFKGIATKEIPLEIRDKKKLKLFAHSLGINLELSEEKILDEVAKKIFQMFSQQEGELILVVRATQNLIEKWRKYKVIPRGIEREILELFYKTSTVVDHYYKNILLSAVRCSLSDGWGSSLIATELQDILLGTPKPVKSFVNIGENVIFKDMVNVIVHGQDPIMADLLIKASFDSEIVELTKKVGAQGINILGLCDTGNEILMRKGVPSAGTFIHQEAVIATGAIEAMVLDGECVAPNIVQMANQFHTAIITTYPLSMMEGAIYVEFNKSYPLESAKEILKIAISKYKERKNSEINIPGNAVEVISGFSLEALMYIMGGRFRASLELLKENLINGKILGITVITGCDYSGTKENIEVELTKELIANNVLVLTTGCSAIKLGMAGLLTQEAVKLAGEGLREVVEGIGCPPVLHMGSFVDNSRILLTLTEIINTGGLGKDICDLPVVVCIPQWISKKAISIGMYFSASGLQVVFGSDFPFIGGKKTAYFLFDEIENYFGGSFRIASKVSDFVNIVMDRIWQKRKELGIDKPKPRILYDMAMRRALDEKMYIPSMHKLGFFKEK
uniref:anaerobic carbon-monoxide dehydrogenase n=1 Tax=Thermodesulfobacterium geofontis TaxID=1295609 RepID=A0A7V6CDG2_9BACT